MCRVLEVPEEGEVAIMGTLYKDMKLKPSILDEYVKDRALEAQLGERGGAERGEAGSGVGSRLRATEHCDWRRCGRELLRAEAA